MSGLGSGLEELVVHLLHGRTQRRRKSVVVRVTPSDHLRQQPVEALGEEGGQVVDLVLQVGGHFCVGSVCRRRAGGVVALRLVSQR